MRLIAKFLALPLSEQRDAAEAIFCLISARLLLFLPFRWLVRLIGRPQAVVEGPIVIVDPKVSSPANAVRRAILRVARRLPWQSSCLVSALAARMMLRRRRLPSLLHLGVQSADATALSAHAWLKCGEIDVVGVENAPGFTPVAVFVHECTHIDGGAASAPVGPHQSPAIGLNSAESSSPTTASAAACQQAARAGMSSTARS